VQTAVVDAEIVSRVSNMLTTNHVYCQLASVAVIFVDIIVMLSPCCSEHQLLHSIHLSILYEIPSDSTTESHEKLRVENGSVSCQEPEEDMRYELL